MSCVLFVCFLLAVQPTSWNKNVPTFGVEYVVTFSPRALLKKLRSSPQQIKAAQLAIEKHKRSAILRTRGNKRVWLKIVS